MALRKKIVKETKIDDGMLISDDIKLKDNSSFGCSTKKKNEYSPILSLYDKTGYKVTTKIASTLQGSIYKAINSSKNECIVKRTSVRLHNKGVGRVNGKLYKINENIVNEASIMKYLNFKKPKGSRKCMVQFIDFYCDGKNCFLLMEYGGKSMVDHVIEFHHKIDEGKIKLKIWKQHVKILFKQMSAFVYWLHNDARLAHLDISLDNMCIKDCIFKNGKFVSHGQINFIDFGLAKRFTNNKSFDKCTKYVGKTPYKSPEIYCKIPFNAFKSDSWSLGVVLYVMLFGLMPYNFTKPRHNDSIFDIIYHGKARTYNYDINKSKYLSESSLDLLSNIFCSEYKRLTINKIMEHSYLN